MSLERGENLGERLGVREHKIGRAGDVVDRRVRQMGGRLGWRRIRSGGLVIARRPKADVAIQSRWAPDVSLDRHALASLRLAMTTRLQLALL